MTDELHTNIHTYKQTCWIGISGVLLAFSNHFLELESSLSSDVTWNIPEYAV